MKQSLSHPRAGRRRRCLSNPEVCPPDTVFALGASILRLEKVFWRGLANTGQARLFASHISFLRAIGKPSVVSHPRWYAASPIQGTYGSGAKIGRAQGS